MKFLRYLIISLGLLGYGNALAQQEAVGTWQGALTLDPGPTLTVQFVIEQASDGSYSALMNSPTSDINNMAASSVDINGTSVSLEFASLSGAFEGEIVEGSLSGEWNQPGSSFPLVLNPYVIYDPDEATIEMLAGFWYIEGNENTLFAFGRDAEGNLIGTRSAPAQGPQAIASLGGYGILYSQFTFTYSASGGNRFLGDITDSAMEGTLEGRPMKFVRAEASSPPTLNLTEADQNRLLGSWRADLGPYSLAMRFQRNDEGEFAGYFDSPSQGAGGIPITAITVNGNQLAAAGLPYGEFSGEIGNGEIVGEWKQGTSAQTLTYRKD